MADQALEATAVETLQNQFSGYGSTAQVVARSLERAHIKDPLESWTDETIESIVSAFTDEKFPTVIALNKIDHPDADKVSTSKGTQGPRLRIGQNIAKIAKTQPPESLVLTSAISEIFLRRLVKQGYIRYAEGTDAVDTRDDVIALGEADGGGLRPMDDKLAARLDKLRDLVLFRFASTGVAEVLRRAAALLGLVPVFPVRSVLGLGLPGPSVGGQTAGGGADKKKLFRDCVLVKRYVRPETRVERAPDSWSSGTTVGDVYRKVMGDAPLGYVETVGGLKVSEDDVVMAGKNDVGQRQCGLPIANVGQILSFKVRK